MKKKLTAFLAVLLVLCLCMTGCFGPKAEQGESSVTPLLYRVTDQNGNVLWLFGSIHVGTENYYPLPDYVLDAFDGSDALAVELDIMAMEWNFVQQTQLMQLLIYTDGSTITDHLSQQTYERGVEILRENNAYNESMDFYMPAMWWSMIESFGMEKMGVKTSLGIDRHLLKRARSDGKPVREVESAEFQYAIMAGFSPALQQILLEGAIYSYDNLEESKADMEKMIALWSSGDEAAFAAYLNQETEITDPEEAALYQEYNDGLITQRNQTMTEYAEAALLSGEEIFLCVGAAHIVGEGAIAQNLRQMGYQVEIVQ